MNIYQIDEINYVVRDHRNDFLYSVNKSNWCGCFIGTYMEWRKFQMENKNYITWSTKYGFNLKNGERWSWLPEGQKPFPGCRFSRIIVPRRIEYYFFLLEILSVVGQYCTEIEWYGEPDKVNTTKENKI